MIRKASEIRLNVRPVFIGFVHLCVFEGPCRFGQGDQLTTDYDVMMNKELFKEFQADMEKYMPGEVNLLDPIYVERDDDLLTKEDLFEKLSEGMSETDLYIFKFGIARDDILVEFAQRFRKPVAMVPHNCCSITISYSALKARGLEVYAYLSWEECVNHMKVLRVRKVLANTRIMLTTRLNSSVSFSSIDTFLSLEDVTQKFGTRFRCINFHELVDQTHMVPADSNPTIPGRRGHNITAEDMKQIEALTDALIGGSSECGMERDKLLKSVKAYYTVRKLLDVNDCNAFTAPCPDVCATRRMNEEQIVFCLTHSLLNEQGIPSACEYDIPAVLAMMILGSLAGKAPYMGNVNPVFREDGALCPVQSLFEEDLKDIEDETNLMHIFHSTPNRKLKGFDQEPASYGIQPFAYGGGWGGTLRYDFTQDTGQVITLMRIGPDAKKMFVGTGTIVKGSGFRMKNCTVNMIFRVKDQKDFFHKQCEVGNHLPLVYGDYVEQLQSLGQALGLEVITA